jgi:hypothetical protein
MQPVTAGQVSTGPKSGEWPVAILNLIFSNLNKQIFSEGRGLLDAKEALYLQIHNRVA